LQSGIEELLAWGGFEPTTLAAYVLSATVPKSIQDEFFQAKAGIQGNNPAIYIDHSAMATPIIKQKKYQDWPFYPKDQPEL